MGKHVAFTSLIPALVEKNGEPIQLYTPYTGVFAYNPNVKMAFESTTLPLALPEIIDGEVVFVEPYKSNFVVGKQHLIESYCDLLGVEYNKETMVPQMFTEDCTEEAEAALKNIGVDKDEKFILLQLFGGQTTQGYNPNQAYTAGGASGRNYHPYLAQQLVDLFTEKFPDYKIVKWGLPNEPMLNNVIPLDTHYRNMHQIAGWANSFITSDSSLHHIAKAAGTSGVVIYGDTRFSQFGYETDENINFWCHNEWNDKVDVMDPRNVLVDPNTICSIFEDRFYNEG